ncbi:MAG: DUF4340 domain-containing protein [Mariprofundaceae bacterium]|nr:DUF4340 domain-containing protein [Mariprofundaceae bacterium]
MMKQVIVAVVIIALGAVFFWQKEDTSQAQQQMPAWATIDAKQVNSMELRQAGKAPIVLKRSGTQWLVGKTPADVTAVERLLQDLSSMQPVRVVTRKRSHDADLGLDAQGVAILLSDSAGKHLLDATLGKQGANLLTTYLRPQGSDVALAMNKALNWQIHRSADAWKQAAPAPTKSPVLDAYTTSSETHHHDPYTTTATD